MPCGMDQANHRRHEGTDRSYHGCPPYLVGGLQDADADLQREQQLVALKEAASRVLQRWKGGGKGAWCQLRKVEINCVCTGQVRQGS